MSSGILTPLSNSQYRDFLYSFASPSMSIWTASQYLIVLDIRPQRFQPQKSYRQCWHRRKNHHPLISQNQKNIAKKKKKISPKKARSCLFDLRRRSSKVPPHPFGFVLERIAIRSRRLSQKNVNAMIKSLMSIITSTDYRKIIQKHSKRETPPKQSGLWNHLTLYHLLPSPTDLLHLFHLINSQRLLSTLTSSDDCNGQILAIDFPFPIFIHQYSSLDISSHISINNHTQISFFRTTS